MYLFELRGERMSFFVSADLVEYDQYIRDRAIWRMSGVIVKLFGRASWSIHRTISRRFAC